MFFAQHLVTDQPPWRPTTTVCMKSTNTHLQPGLSAWTQATLPVTLGGLGIHSAVEVAPSAFLSSVHSSSELVKAILPPSFSSLPSPLTVEAQTCWSVGHDHQPPEGTAASKQKSWDGVMAASVAERLLQSIRFHSSKCTVAFLSRNVSILHTLTPVSDFSD